MVGVDTTLAAVMRFLLAMMLHPEVQKKAQEEIDRVIGTHRLPTMEEYVLFLTGWNEGTDEQYLNAQSVRSSVRRGGIERGLPV